MTATALNPYNLPPHLVGMTQAKWDALAPAERDAMRDTSALHPMLIGLEGATVTVSPPRPDGRHTFRVGRTTGWRPVHLAMHANARGSSDVINAADLILSVKIRQSVALRRRN